LSLVAVRTPRRVSVLRRRAFFHRVGPVGRGASGRGLACCRSSFGQESTPARFETKWESDTFSKTNANVIKPPDVDLIPRPPTVTPGSNKATTMARAHRLAILAGVLSLLYLLIHFAVLSVPFVDPKLVQEILPLVSPSLKMGSDWCSLL
jgi:hypothetical protein